MSNFEKYLDYKIVIWGYPYGKHTHSWIQFWFHRAFLHLGFEVDWVANLPENLPSKSQKTIFISASWDNSALIDDIGDNWIVFDHGADRMMTERYIPFSVKVLSLPNYPPTTIERYRGYLANPKIFWATDLLPHEMKFVPYHYKNTEDVRFIGSWWIDNFDSLEKARLWCLLNWKTWHQDGKHIFLRYKKFVSEGEIDSLSREAYLTLSIQWKPQVKSGYLPCRLLKNMSYSVLGLSNNLFMADLFDEDEIIIDRDIFTLLDKAEKVVKDKKVDDYTKKALEKVKRHHTYLNRIEELFSYL